MWVYMCVCVCIKCSCQTFVYVIYHLWMIHWSVQVRSAENALLLFKGGLEDPGALASWMPQESLPCAGTWRGVSCNQNRSAIVGLWVPSHFQIIHFPNKYPCYMPIWWRSPHYFSHCLHHARHGWCLYYFICAQDLTCFLFSGLWKVAILLDRFQYALFTNSSDFL